MRKYTYIIYIILLLLPVMTSCLKNDFPYPVVQLRVDTLEVEGQTGPTRIDREEHAVHVPLAEEVNPRKVRIARLAITPEANIDVRVGEVVDLSQPFTLNMSMYDRRQEWTLVGEQHIERYMEVSGQIGETKIFPETRTVVGYVREDEQRTTIELLHLKLGPEGSLYNGGAALPRLIWVKKSNFYETTVRVSFSDFIDEEWRLLVYPTRLIEGISRVDAWTKVAWIMGEVAGEGSPRIEYKEVSGTQWQELAQEAITVKNGKLSARITHLKPQTDYVCRLMGTEGGTSEVKFTTEPEFPLPNGSLDGWSVNAKGAYVPWTDADTPFWDTGNHGSITLRKNVTEPTTEVRPGSSASGKAAKLTSQFVGIATIGKFAAGNLFVGDYVGTEGTNGILHFGKSFTGRPTELKGFLKYSPEIIDYASSGYETLKGQHDTGIVWMALGDWEQPVEIRTNPANPRYFDVNDPHIIAYGELLLTEQTADYHAFSLPLTYRSTERKPTYLIIVCSASRLGDYFTGASGSTLNVDDLSLEYDYK